MNSYELMFIIDPDLEEEAAQKVVAAVKEAISGVGGEVTEERMMGKRRLAYEIKKKTDGLYVLLYFQAPPAAMEELNRALRINEQVLRHLITRAKHNAPLTD